MMKMVVVVVVVCTHVLLSFYVSGICYRCLVPFSRPLCLNCKIQLHQTPPLSPPASSSSAVVGVKLKASHLLGRRSNQLGVVYF
jgi:hypothetical protein